jgi:Fe2+ or Zn2+ uptake regulation protein
MKTVDELNKKPDGRYGKDKRVTSKLQEEILKILPKDTGLTNQRHEGDKIVGRSAGISPTEILKRLGVEKPTMSQRASISRSLARLNARKLVMKYEAGNGRAALRTWIPPSC